MYHFILIIIVCLFSTFAFANERHALVIGNSDYADQPLKNPLNDATDMVAQLELLGYKIHGGGPALDLDRSGIENTILRFAQQLPEEANAVFYFAGHGVANERDNYIIPVGHDIAFQEQLPDRAVSIGSIVDLLKTENPNGTNVLLFDACRDNPLGSSFRSSRRGLVRVNNIPQGVFLGYAADYGQVASDGVGRNGTYTSELLRMLRDESDLIIELAHRSVKNRVYEQTARRQSPVSENKIYGGDWCFGDCKQPIVSVKPFEPPTEEELSKPSDIKISRNRWVIAGGVVLAAVVVALASDDSSGTAMSVEINNDP